MRGPNPVELYRGHEIRYDEDGWWQVEASDPEALKEGRVVMVGGLANGIDEAMYFAKDFVDGMSERSEHRRIANVVLRKSAAERVLSKDLQGRRSDYYVVRNKTPAGPYVSLAKAKRVLLNHRGRARRRNWTTPSDAAEYTIKRWGYANYIAGASRDQTWAQFANFIRRTGDHGAEDAARSIENLPGLPRDFAVPVDTFKTSQLQLVESGRLKNRSGGERLTWRKVKRGDGTLSAGDFVSNELAPGIRYELERGEHWNVVLHRGEETMCVASRKDVAAAKRAASHDATEILGLAREIAAMTAPNPSDRWDLQTVIVDKSTASTRDAAGTIAGEFGNRNYTSRATSDSWRFRQRPTTDFVKGSFRTRRIPGRGVSLVYGRLKRGSKARAKR